MLSYGYKVPFLGLDHLRAEAGLSAIGLANTWVPITLTIVTVLLAAQPHCGTVGTKMLFVWLQIAPLGRHSFSGPEFIAARFC